MGSGVAAVNRIIILAVGALAAAAAAFAVINDLTGNESSPPKDLGMTNGKAPEFSVTGIDGRMVSLETLRGKPTVIWFMATWCPSCIRTARVIAEATQGIDVNVVAVSVWTKPILERIGALNPSYPPPDTPEKLRRFLGSYGSLEWIGVLDDGTLYTLFNVTSLDLVYVLDGDGRIVWSGVPWTPEPLREALRLAG